MKQELAQPVITIRTRTIEHCPQCGSTGRRVYDDMTDRLFGAPGVWGFRRCAAHNCQLVWLDPAPIKDDIHLAYQRYYTHSFPPPSAQIINKKKAWQGYRSLVFGNEQFPATPLEKLMGVCFFLLPNRKAALEYPIRQLAGMRIGRALEIGCGAGDLLVQMKEIGWQTVGIDFDPAAIAAANQRGLDVRVGDLDAQAFPDESFDVVLMNHVLEHLPEPQYSMREIRRILRPGGRLIAVTPNFDSWGSSHFGKNWRGLEPPRHLHLFNRQSATLLAQIAGFTVVNVQISVRSSIQVLKESLTLRSPHTNPNALYNRIYLEGIWMWEWCLTKLGQTAGEELLLVAGK